MPVAVFPDPVFALDLSGAKLPHGVDEIADGTPVIGVNLRPWPAGTEDGFLARISEALSAVAKVHFKTTKKITERLF